MENSCYLAFDMLLLGYQKLFVCKKSIKIIDTIQKKKGDARIITGCKKDGYSNYYSKHSSNYFT